MLSLKRFFLGMSLLMVALFAVACASSTSTSTGSSGGTTPSKADHNSVAVLKTASVALNGQSVTILANAQGMTLYYLKPDTATRSVCSGACAGNWPPLLFTGSGSPMSESTLSGTLSVVGDANGQQVEYNGHPLYRFAGDTAPGETHAEWIKGVWFVASSTLPVQSAPQSTPTSNGY